MSWRLYREIRRRGFFKREVNAFIALTEFSRQKFIQGGLPADKIYVKPNFLSDPLKEYPHLVRREAGGYGAVFIGRLSSEKGVTELVRAWKGCDYPLEVIGQGALESTLRQMKIPRVSFTGGLSHEEALRRLSGSAFLIFPSVWYETFGLTMIEAMALEKPVLASRLGGREYIVPEGKAGILYDPFKSGELESGIRKMIHLSTAEKEKMGDYGRKYYLENFTPEVNYQKLMEIYERVIRGIRVYNFKRKIKNKDFSLFSTNCNGGILLHDLGLRFNSPTINLWFEVKDFLKYMNNLERYSKLPLFF